MTKPIYETNAYRGFNFMDETPDKVRDIIADNKHTGRRLRIWQGDVKNGKPWLEENDIIGHIGRSTGSVKIPLLIHNSRSYGGGEISTRSIVAIQDVKTKRFLYKHEGFTVPEYVLQTALIDNINKFAAEVWIKGGDLQARFHTEQQAIKYMAYMRGERMAK